MTARHALAALALALAPVAATAGPSPTGDVLRVCADPNNMPFSNRDGEGFENKLAELVAEAMGRHVEYTWWAQRRGFIRNTLKAGRCDVVMGIPLLDMLTPTRAYYSSRYVFVTRADRDLSLHSLAAPELRDLTIGVHLIGDDGSNTPPADALGARGIVDNVRGYPIYGDYREPSPPSRLLDALVAGEIDVAAAWGPLAGYYAAHSDIPLHIEPIEETSADMPLVFQFPIAMGVRKGDFVLRNELNEIIQTRRDDIDRLLDSFGVPRF